MSREIKFKVWDKKEKKFVNLDHKYLRFWDDASGSVYNIRDDKTLDFSDAKILQYTGLKDKNGKEIYEGDILLNVSDFSKEQERISEVIWLDGSFIEHTQRICGKESDYLEPFHFRNAVAKEREVIGNVYENLNLIA